MWRKFLRAIGCLSYLGMLGILFGLVSYLAFSQFVRRGVTPAPALAGLTEEDARALLTDQGLRVEWKVEEDRYDERVPAGHVLIQRPPAGTLVKRGSEVTIILSLGPQLLVVPDVRGSALQAARVTLAAAGLTVGRTFNVYLGAESLGPEKKSGGVIATRPASHEHVERAATVDLFLARESSAPTYVMPDLVRRSYSEVRHFFESRGFRLGRVGYESYPGLAPGTVLRQFPPAGHALRQGDVISLGVVVDENAGAATEGEDDTAEDGTAEDGTAEDGTEEDGEVDTSAPPPPTGDDP